MFIPLVLVFVIPVVYSVAISLVPGVDKPSAAMLDLMSVSAFSGDYRAFWLDAFTTLLCPLLFLCVPIICSVASAACAFVSERESGTLETLMLSSMNTKSVFNAKITACTLVSVAISLISFLVLTITLSVADIMLSAPFFFSMQWLATALLLMPVLSLFSVVFVSLIIRRVRTTAEALQTMGYLILPFVIIYIMQLAGVFKITFLSILALAIILLVLSVVMFNASARGFQAENLF